MITLHNTDCVEFIQTLPDESIDVICIDPPYLYLKNQKLERPFDERLFFDQCKRVLTKNGFIVMFGRGTSFYRWNCILDDIGMKFKEEIIWDKRMPGSPLNPVLRVHETVSIHNKGTARINKSRVDFKDAFKFNPEKVADNLNRCVSAFGNMPVFEEIKKYFKSGDWNFGTLTSRKSTATMASDIKTGNQAVYAARMIVEGTVERTIIPMVRDHYKGIHPTQKPVRLLERLLALVIPDKPRNEIVVADFFGGSMSCMEAVHNMGMQGIACEIDEEYFQAGKKRIDSLKPIQKDLFNT